MTPRGTRAPREVLVRIETPRGSFSKRDGAGGLDFVSPFPCPYNYGSLPGTTGADGEPCDALVLGPRLAAGVECRRRVLGVAAFVDGGVRDDKLVCGLGGELGRPATRAGIRLFFRAYALVKAATAGARGRRGPTRFEGLRIEPGGDA